MNPNLTKISAIKGIMVGFFTNLLGVSELPEETQKFMIRLFNLWNLVYFLRFLGQTFLVLYFIQGVGYYYTGILVAVEVLVQLVTDYPTGSLADYIGQRYVIAIAMVLVSIGYILITEFQIFSVYLLACAIFGLASGQFSGSFESYMDNNYKTTTGEYDKDRKIYGFAYQRIMTLFTGTTAIAIVIGGFIAYSVSRIFIFQFESIMLLLAVPLIIFYLKDAGDSKTSTVNRKNGFFKPFAGGLKFFVSSRKNFFLIMARVSLMIVEGLWVGLMVIPFYLAYTGNDAGVGIYRSTMLIIGFLISFYTAKYTQKMSEKVLGKLNFLYYIILFPGLILVLYFIPGKDVLNPEGIFVGALVLIMSISFVGVFVRTIFQRVISAQVPSESRNSIYSLIPTISNFFQIFLLPIMGYFIEIGHLLAGAEFLLVISLLSLFFLFAYLHTDNSLVQS